MTKDTVTIEVPKGSKVLVNGKEVDTNDKPEFVSRFNMHDFPPYFLDGCGNILKNNKNPLLISYGNAFLTDQDAIKERDRRALETRWLKRIAELNHQFGWVCDWDDGGQQKCFVSHLDHDYKELSVDWDTGFKRRSTEHYFCGQAKGTLFKEFTDNEIKTIYFGEVG